MKMPNPDRWTSGFTVTELLITVALAILLLAIATPAFMNLFPTFRVSAAARQVAIDLQLARVKAISQNTNTTVTFNVSNGTYSFGAESRDLDELYPGITIVSVLPTNPIFYPRGTVNANTTIKLSNGSAQKWVCLNIVGRVNIEDSSCT